MAEIFRLSWDMPTPVRAEELQAAGVPVDRVPEQDWQRTVRVATGGDIVGQAATLKRWADDGTDYVRNVVLERAEVVAPDWQEIPIP